MFFFLGSHLFLFSGVVSDEDTTEFWETTKEVTIGKGRRNKNRVTGGDLLMVNEGEVNRKMKKIVLLEFKRTTYYSESYYLDIHVEGDNGTTHSHPNGPKGASDRSRMGGRGCPVGLRTTVG